MERMTDSEKWKLLAKTDLNQAASVLGEDDKDKAANIAQGLGTAYMVEVVSQLSSDVAADLLRNLPEHFREQVLSELAPDKYQALREILSYPVGTAGSLMSKEFLSVNIDATIGEAVAYLQSIPRENRGKVSYIYVIDQNKRLAGVIQVRDLVFYSSEKMIKDIMVWPIVQVETGMSQIDVSRLLQRHRYLGLPVVDAAQRLVGVVSADSVLQTMEAEAVDDMAKIIGTSAEEIKTRSVWRILGMRFPWLLVNIISGLLCAFISGVFQNDLAVIAALFLFVPVVLGLSESTGVQGATMVVRNIAMGHVAPKDLRALFVKEMLVGILIGMICGSIVGLTALLWQQHFLLGTALAVSMTTAITISGLIGLTLPLLFRALKIDPALASGPFVLAICDLQTLLVYFVISGRILSLG